MPNLVEKAELLSETAWNRLIRPPTYVIETEPRRKPVNVKERIVKREKKKILRMEFKKFRHYFMMLPCQIVKTGRKLVYRLLGWNEYLDVFFRAMESFRCPLRC